MSQRSLKLSFKPPVHAIHILTSQLLGMATAVRAEPAKYNDEHHSVLSTLIHKEIVISLTVTGMGCEYYTFNFGYASQHSHGKKNLSKKTSFIEEKNRKERHPRLKLNSNSDKTIIATPVPVRVYIIYRVCSWSWSLVHHYG